MWQITIPLLVSVTRRWGLFWNHPGDGAVQLLPNSTNFTATTQRQIDLWVTTSDSSDSDTAPFADIMRQYADATGHAPVLPAFATGFWQSRMRYRTTDELLDVAER